ncbi:hypothetical protein Zm00014a_006393 [Zea mays]|uniref:Uncharacterized protein n=1 Tax=Zea mays TaxID=4577 RepID=A0A3L6D7V2_MAIZE|nr:hypothetical protein Zm00014a_006393 [Zea mays]
MMIFLRFKLTLSRSIHLD